MKNLISVAAICLLLMGCGHHDKSKAEVYYIDPEPVDDEEPEPEPEECDLPPGHCEHDHTGHDD